MDNGGQTIENSGVVEDMTGGLSFQGNPGEHYDPMKRADPNPRPDHVPEKFWDAEKGSVNTEALLKSYSELEKQFSSKEPEAKDPEEKDPEAKDPEEKEGAKEPEEKDADEKDPEAKEPEEKPSEAALASAIESAQNYFAEHNDLPADARKDLHALGISDAIIDLQIAGAKAYRAALETEAVKAAGVEDYSAVEAAITWAADNWSPKKIEAFNAQAGDVETIGLAVSGLFKDFRAANPGEGELLSLNSGGSRGDVYTDKSQYAADLKKADDIRDPAQSRAARREAVAKMQRSLKAKSIK